MFKGIIFDFDGTVMDSMWIWKDFSTRFLASLGIKAPSDIDSIMLNFDVTRSVRYFNEHFATGMDDASLEKAISDFVLDDYRNRTSPRKGAEPFLKQLKAEGIATCVATASIPLHVQSSLEANGMAGLFGFVLTTEEVGSDKRKPDIFLECARRMGLSPSEVLVFEDSAGAAKVASSAGFRVVGVREETQSREDRKALEDISEIYIEDFSDDLLSTLHKHLANENELCYHTTMSEDIKPGLYRHFKGNQYEVLFTAIHSETREEMVVYRALYGEFGLWVRPASMWNETIQRDGQTFKRFTYIGPKTEPSDS